MINLSVLLSNYFFDLKLRNTYLLYGSTPLAAAITSFIQSASPEVYGNAVTYARDFLIGSDLKRKEKDQFYTDLKKQGFFEILAKNLNHANRGIIHSSIYNIGKISRPENTQYLEYAYENYYRSSVEPILSYACLFELGWLRSNKYLGYLEDLENSNDIISIFIIALLIDSNEDLEVSEITLEKVSDKLFGVPFHYEGYINSIVKRVHLLENKFNELQAQIANSVLVKIEFERFVEEFRLNES